MKRTICQLSKQEIEILKKIIPTDDARLANLFPRLSSISTFLGKEVQLQANREEVEAILDLLPPPGSEHPILDSLRQKLMKSVEEMS